MQTQLKFRTLIELFNESLGSVEPEDKECLEIVRAERQEKLTFKQLKTGAQDFALRLIQGRGIRPKDKVAILGKNRTDWDIALWGTILTGAVPVLIDSERPVEGVKDHLISTDSRLLVMADDYQDTESRNELKKFAVERGLGLIEMTDDRRNENAVICEKISSNSTKVSQLLNEVHTEIEADDTAVIICTSGTTSDPREVELTHTNLIANIQGALQAIRVTVEDRLGHVIPPHHSFGLTVTKLLALWVGATSIYTNRYRQIPQLIGDKNITIFIGVPALFTVLAKKIEEHLAGQKEKNPLIRLLDRYLPKQVGKRIAGKYGWGGLRFFISGAAGLPKWVLEVFWKRGLQLYEGYGTTENSPVYGFNANYRKLGSVGRPIPTLLVKIVNDQTQTLQPGEKGEIVLGGACIMKGYYKNPRATEAIIKTDNKGIRWLHTGDLGYLDEDGHLFITGRKKYLIVLPGGKNVNPELVESVLSNAQYVKEVLVVPGLRKDSAGAIQETVRAIVQPDWDVIETRTNLSYSDLVRQPQLLKALIWQGISECQQKSRYLSHFERVSSHHLEIKIDEFQKTSTGKIKREVYIRI